MGSLFVAFLLVGVVTLLGLVLDRLTRTVHRLEAEPDSVVVHRSARSEPPPPVAAPERELILS